jgi:hypothetical protein
MSLSCDCDWYPEPGDTWVDAPYDFAELDTSRRKRCKSCNHLIDIGSLALKFDRYKVPDTDAEVRIYGEEGEIPIAPYYLCESCGDIYMSLSELGFCLNMTESMKEQLEQYHEYVETEREYKKTTAKLRGDHE